MTQVEPGLWTTVADVGAAVFILLGVSILSYGLMRAAPGGLTQFYANPRIPKETIERLETQLGLNDPTPVS